MHTINPSALTGTTPARRYQANIDALQTLKSLSGAATPAQKEIMAAYAGWGCTATLKMAYPDGGVIWRKTSKEFDALKLTHEEREALLKSQLNAHFTSIPIIQAIYKALWNAGIKNWDSPAILEPSAGIGNFIGAMPPELQQKAKITAVELDILTGQLLQAIYPEIKTFICGYEKAPLPKGFFDLIISNVPFGDYAVTDSQYPKGLRTIHDYFFVKAIEHLKPNGIIAFITSRYTMDKKETRVREYLGKHTKLLAACRLPNNAFKSNAGTEVVTDIIILQKTSAPHTWLSAQPIQINDTQIQINEFYVRKPEFIIGQQALTGSMYSQNEYTVEPLPVPLDTAIYNCLTEQLQVLQQARTVTPQKQEIAEKEELFTGDSERFKPMTAALFNLYNTAKKYIQAMQLGIESQSIQSDLNSLYDNFRSAYGPINAIKGLKKDSPIVLFVKGLERKDGSNWVKSHLFTANTIIPYTKPSIQTSEDALQWSLSEKGKVDLDFIAQLRGIKPEEALTQLTGLVFKTPNGEIQSRSEYLSGNVREKLREAKVAAALDAQFQINVDELTKALPATLKPGEIIARLGANWVAPKHIKAFIDEILPNTSRTEVHHNPLTNEWSFHDINFATKTSLESKTIWGTERKDAIELILDGLNSRTPAVYDWDVEKEKWVINNKETLLAQAKLTDLQTKFRSWLWEDEQRATEAADTYNNTINCFVRRHFDGSHLRFPGSNSNITLRTSQKSGISRILSSQTSLIGHLVGAGKTFIAVASAMEGKRIGLLSKSLLIVPNHLTEQAGAMARTLYPGINLLVPDKEDTTAENRGSLLTRIATNNWDLVILSHTAFQLLPLHPDTLQAYIEADLQTFKDALAEVEKSTDKDDRLTAKQIAKKIKRFEEHIESIQEMKRDSIHTITFEDLGINALFVDEADLFKNLEFHTNMTRIAGIPNSGSKRASDLKYKTQWLIERGHRVAFMTGTPISNTLAEAWICQMYLQPDLMKSLGFHHFDNWASTFGEATTSLEMKPDGSGYRLNTRFNKFINIQEMMALWGNTLDLKTVEELDLPASTIPFTGPQIIQTNADEHLKEYVKKLGERADRIRSGSVDPTVDNMLVVTNDGRKSALHMALVDSTYQGESPKVTELCVTVKKVYDQFDADKGTQIIFIDIATPKAKATKKDESPEDEAESLQEVLCRDGIYGIIKKKLTSDFGIPANEIAFIHDAKTNAAKLTLFNRMNRGEVRLLLASTEKAGAGTNVQERLVAIHHLTTPWRPRDLDQRNGRMITAFTNDKVYPRPGNKLAEKGAPLALYYHITKGSVDGFVWQLIESKQKFISAVLRSNLTGREVEDVDQAVLNASQIKAIASGNPLIIERVELEAELNRLIRLYDSWITSRNVFERNIKTLPWDIKQLQNTLSDLRRMAELSSVPHEDFTMEVNGKTFTERGDAGKEILQLAYHQWLETGTIEKPIGKHRGLTIYLKTNRRRDNLFSLTDADISFGLEDGKQKVYFALSESYSSIIQSLTYHINNLATVIKKRENELTHYEQQLAKAQAEGKKGFSHSARYKEVGLRLAALDQLLTQSGENLDLTTNIPTLIPEAMQETQTVTMIPQSTITTVAVAAYGNVPKLQPIRPTKRRREPIPSTQQSLFSF